MFSIKLNLTKKKFDNGIISIEVYLSILKKNNALLQNQILTLEKLKEAYSSLDEFTKNHYEEGLQNIVYETEYRLKCDGVLDKSSISNDSLRTLHQQGIINESEYKDKKKEIKNSLEKVDLFENIIQKKLKNKYKSKSNISPKKQKPSVIINKEIIKPQIRIEKQLWQFLGCWFCCIVLSFLSPLIGLTSFSIATTYYFFRAWKEVFHKKINVTSLLLLIAIDTLCFIAMFKNIDLSFSSQYEIDFVPSLSNWGILVLEHLFRATDIIDLIESYGIPFYNIKVNGQISCLYVIIFHTLVDIYFFYLLFKLLRNFNKKNRFKNIHNFRKKVLYFSFFILFIGLCSKQTTLLQWGFLGLNIHLFLYLWHSIKYATSNVENLQTLIFLLIGILTAWIVWFVITMSIASWIDSSFFSKPTDFLSLVIFSVDSFLRTLDFLDFMNVYRWQIQDFNHCGIIASSYVVFMRTVLSFAIFPFINKILGFVLSSPYRLKSIEELIDIIHHGGKVGMKAFEELATRKVVIKNYIGNNALKKIDFSHAKLAQANLESLNLEGLCFRKADLRNAILKNANLANANLSHANLSYSNLSNATLTNANLNNAVLYKAILKEAKMTKVKAMNIDIRGGLLIKAKLNNIDLRAANLENIDLTDANLESANLCFSNLKNAKMENTCLVNATLKNTNLKNANLHNANLENAFLEKVNLSRTKVSKHQLEKCSKVKFSILNE